MFLVVLMMTPLPKIPLMGLAGAVFGISTIKIRKGKEEDAEKAAAAKAKPEREERPEKLILPDPMEVEVGYGLIRLVDRKQGGDLLDRITNMRRQMAQELGIVVPPVRIRDNIQLQPNQYHVKIRGGKVAEGEVLPGHLLAIDSGMVVDKVAGTPTTEPAFGLPALWIAQDQRQPAERNNYTVVEASSVLSTHLTETIKRHADELVTRHEVNRLLDNLKERSPKLVEELVPTVIKPGEIQKALQYLLRERVPIRDLETILETLGDWASRTKDPDVLVEYVRTALARTICDQYRAESGTLACITFDPKIEESIGAHLEVSEHGTLWAMPPNLQTKIVQAVKSEVDRVLPSLEGRAAVILCAPRVRLWVRRMLEASLPHVAVLSYNEIVRGVQVESRGMVVLNDESEDV